jgi:FixJ family two-component response regulator
MFIDDNVELLKAYHHLNLPNKIVTESDPEKAVQELINNTSKACIFHDITDEHYTDSLQTNDAAVISFTFNSIKDLIHDNDKYEKYGVVITDYKMPIMNGIELCNNISELNIVKILLTGEYKPLDALTALHDDTIDYFLQKGKETTNDELLNSIRKLELKHFKNITQNFFNLTNNKFAFLADKSFATIINNLIKDNAITEYYLLNNTGCFLMINNESQYMLNIYSDNDLDTFCDMYAHIDTGILKKIQQRELIPNFELSNHANTANDFYSCIKSDKYYYNFSKLEFNNLFLKANNNEL